MVPRKKLETNPEPTLTNAVERAGLVIRGLQSRLKEKASPPAQGAPPEDLDAPGDLDTELQQYFRDPNGHGGMGGRTLEEIRSGVIDGVVERILQEWDNSGQGAWHSLEREVMERLIERVLDQLRQDRLPEPPLRVARD